MVQNVVGSLVVTLLTQTAEFTKGLGKATSALVKEVGKWGQIFAAVTGGPEKMLEGIMGGSIKGWVAGLKSIYDGIRSITGEAAAIQQGAIRSGFSIEGYQQLGAAAKKAGMEFEGVDRIVSRMLDTLVDATGDEQGGIIGRLGLDPEKLAAMSPEDAFRKIADSIANMRNEADRTSAAMQIFGKEGKRLMDAWAKRGPADMETMMVTQLAAQEAEMKALEKRVKEASVGLMGKALVGFQAGLHEELSWIGLGHLIEDPAKQMARDYLAEQARMSMLRRQAQSELNNRKLTAAAQMLDQLTSAANKAAGETQAENWEKVAAAIGRLGGNAKEAAKQVERIRIAEQEKDFAAWNAELNKYRAQYDPLFAYQQAMGELAQYAHALPPDVLETAMKSLRGHAVAGLAALEPALATTSPTGAEARTAEAYRAILEIEKGRDNALTEKLQEQIQQLQRIEENTRREAGLEVVVM